MKRKILLCCLLVTSCIAGYAQSTAKKQAQATVQPAQTGSGVQSISHAHNQNSSYVQKVSKVDFLNKVDQLYNLIIDSKIDDAKKIWEEIDKMINIEFYIYELTLDDLEKTGNKKAISNHSEIISKQSHLAMRIIAYATNMNNMKSELKNALNEFAVNIP